MSSNYWEKHDILARIEDAVWVALEMGDSFEEAIDKAILIARARFPDRKRLIDFVLSEWKATQSCQDIRSYFNK